MSSRDQSLDLSDVKARFEESSAALDEVRQRLAVLAELQQKRMTASEELEQIAQRLTAFTTAAADAVDAIRTAQTTAAGAFDSLRAVVDATDLHRVAASVASLDRRISASDEHQRRALDDLRRELDGRLDAMVAGMGATERAVAEAQAAHERKLAELHEQVEALVAAVSRNEEARAKETADLRRMQEELGARIDNQHHLQREKERLEADLAQVRSELGALTQKFTRLSAVAGTEPSAKQDSR